MFQAMRRVAVLVFVAAGIFGFLRAQNKSSGAEISRLQNAPAQAAQSSGASESPHAFQLDAQGRPVTAGDFVKSGPVIFEDISEKAGLTKWTHKMGAPAKTYPSSRIACRLAQRGESGRRRRRRLRAHRTRLRRRGRSGLRGRLARDRLRRSRRR